MTKMTLQDLKNIYPAPSPHYKSPDGLEDKSGKHGASKKNARHNHKPTWKPPVSKLTPAQWKRHQRKAKKATS